MNKQTFESIEGKKYLPEMVASLAPAANLGQEEDFPFPLMPTITVALQEGDNRLARHLLREALMHRPQDVQIWLLLGWTSETHRGAKACFRRALMLHPGNALALDGLQWASDADFTTQAVQPSQYGLNQVVSAPPITSTTPDWPRHDHAPALAALRRWDLTYSWYLALYLLGLAAAEIVTTFYHAQLGLVLHGAMLVLILLHASLGASEAQQKFLFTLALAPLIRLLSLSMPLAHFHITYWYLIIGAPLLLAALLVLRLTGFTMVQVGLTRRNLPLQALVGLSGLALGWIEYQILKPDPLVESWSLDQIWLPVLILLVFTGFLEEFIFRGLMQRASHDVMGAFGLLYVSLLFAVLCIGYRSLKDFAFVFCVGLAFSLVTRHTRSIWGVSLAHGMTNIALFIIFPNL